MKLNAILTGMRKNDPSAFVLAQDRLDNPKVCQANKDMILTVWNEVYTGATSVAVAPVAQASDTTSTTAEDVLAGIERVAREMAKIRLAEAVQAAAPGDRISTKIRLHKHLAAWTDEATEELIAAFTTVAG